MAVLATALSETVMRALIARLLREGDDVRVLEEDITAAERWRHLGAHVARGDLDDVDLVTRALTNVRTLVVGEAALEPPYDEALLQAAASNPEVRIVALVRASGTPSVDVVRASGHEHVVLVTGRRLLRSPVPVDKIVEAIDAADDLAEDIRVVLDLHDRSAWEQLRLEPPGR